MAGSMVTVDRALSLLRHFSVDRRELGLGELSRVSELDKSTVLRLVGALQHNGFIEQLPDTKKYRLGVAPISLAHVREKTVPMQELLEREVASNAQVLQETAHASLFSDNRLVTAFVAEPSRTLRAHLESNEDLALHATASGVAIAAFLPEDVLNEIMEDYEFKAFAENTPSCLEDLKPLLQEARRTGVAHVRDSFEEGISGTASPIFGVDGMPIGTCAVAAVSQRVTPDVQDRIDREVQIAAAAVTLHSGGRKPKLIAKILERTA